MRACHREYSVSKPSIVCGSGSPLDDNELNLCRQH